MAANFHLATKERLRKFMDTELAKTKKSKKISAIADRELCQWLDEDSDSSDSDSDGFCGAIWKNRWTLLL